MHRSLAFLIAFFAAGQLLAEPVVIEAGNQPGRYYFTITVDAQGRAHVQQIRVVTSVGSAPSPRPNPPDPGPAPPVPSDLSSRVAQWAREVNDPDRGRIARGIAEVYRRIAGLVDSGSVTSVTQLRQATNLLFRASLGDKSELWSPWKEKVDNAVSAMDLNQSVEAWRQISQGMLRVESDPP